METIGVNVNTIVANARTDELLAESQRLTAELQARSAELQVQQEELQRSNAELEDKASLLAAQNRTSRRRTSRSSRRARSWRRAPAAVTGLEVQVGVPGQHEPRAAHPAQQPADPRAVARPEPLAQPHAEAGRVRGHHPLRGIGPAPADQRHPGPVEGRGGEDGRLPRARDAAAAHRVRRGDLPADDHAEGPGVHGHDGRRGAGGPADRRLPAASGAAQPAVQRGEVHRAGRRGAGRRTGTGRRGARRSGPGRRGGGVPGEGHRHRHPEQHLESIFGAFQQADGTTAASTAAPGSACPSPGRSPSCWAAPSPSTAPRPGQHLHPVPARGPARLRGAAGARGRGGPGRVAGRRARPPGGGARTHRWPPSPSPAAARGRGASARAADPRRGERGRRP